MQKISSKGNEFIKHIKKLKEKKYRDLCNEYIIEGTKLIKEAIQENANIKHIVICEDCENTENIPKDLTYEIAKYECVYVTSSIFNSITEVKNPQGILAIIGKNVIDVENKDNKGNVENKDNKGNVENKDNKENVENKDDKGNVENKENKENTEIPNSTTKENSEADQIDYSQDIIVALDDLQDPGNLGTILRTVDSIGLTQILVSKGTADCFNPKVVRSTMGAIFRVKIIECEDLKSTLEEVKKHQFNIMVTSLQTDNSIYNVNYDKKVIVIGNEANGVKQEIQDLADEKVKIPILGKTESLNASVATGVVLYEYVRQKICKSNKE